MALELKQTLKLSQQLVMTPQLQQAIKLLQLNRLELAQHCATVMLENPILEEAMEDPEDEVADETNHDEPSQELSTPKQEDEAANQINWDNFLSSQSKTPGERISRDFDPDLPSFESTLTRAATLQEHLIAQVKLLRLVDDDRKVAEAIIMNLDDDGYLRVDTHEIADQLQTDHEDVIAVLGRIQELDPIGVGARSLQECLFIQSKVLPQADLVQRIILAHMKDLERRNYANICKQLALPKNVIMEAIRAISKFEPKPGRQFYDESSQYITPDIYIYKVKDEYRVVLNEDGMPKLKISALYQSILKGADGKGLTKEYVNEKLKSALWLIRSIHQRQRTIYKVTESIVKMQKDFFERGVTALKPMILKDVADDIGMHESTVSRVTLNKYVHTPQGIFELKYFFNAAIKRVEGNDMASEAVKEKIRVLIANENPKSPYSDQELVELLRRQNIDIARRTVAKYREMLGILSSSKRKQVV